VLQHVPLSDDILDTFRTKNLILSDVLEGKRQAGILAFHDSHFPECAFADNSQQTEVIEVDIIVEIDRLPIGIAH
jgi:hypothetical protein